ncbi:MAG: TauD/TfdA family dioxygenase [Proteobacteria bacterium]|nr:TauD/TfdA family dioxygenase [Pseudomonadota bacterium]
MIKTETELFAELTAGGYSVGTVGNYEHFCALADILGRTTTISEICRDKRRKHMLKSNRAMTPHTDSPYVDFIAWYCARPSSQGGESLLVDVSAVINTLRRDHVIALQATAIRVPDVAKSSSQPATHALLSTDRVYYADWLVPAHVAAMPALRAFRQAVRNTAWIRLSLRAGQALIIDNRRILHGRTSFQDSGGQSRLLIRHWIVSDRPHRFLHN